VKVQNSTASVTSGTGIQGGSTFHYVTVPNREIIAEVHPRKYGIKVERTNPVLLEERPDIVLTFRNIDGSYTGEALIELLEDIIDVLGVIEHEVSDDDDEDEDDFDDDEFEEEEEDELETEETPPPPSRSSEQADGGIFCTCHICRPAK
jgi:hypothetical protein